jgi:hypothetical protein
MALIKVKYLPTILILIIIYLMSMQNEVEASRKFLKGVVVGSLIARGFSSFPLPLPII